MTRQTVGSREYKVMLLSERFAGSELEALHALLTSLPGWADPEPRTKTAFVYG